MVGDMRSLIPSVCVCVILSLCVRNGMSALTNSVASIRTNFIADAVLSADEIGTVSRLAKTCGIDQVVEIRTFHIAPTIVRGIEAIGADHVQGRTVTYETLEVFRDGWSVKSRPTGQLQAVSLGHFWAEGLGIPQTHERTLFTTAKGTIRVHLQPGLPLDMADKIIKAVTSGQIIGNKPIGLQSEDVSHPDWLAPGKSHDHFWIGFSGSLDRYVGVLRGNKVSMVSEINIYN